MVHIPTSCSWQSSLKTFQIWIIQLCLFFFHPDMCMSQTISALNTKYVYIQSQSLSTIINLCFTSIHACKSARQNVLAHWIGCIYIQCFVSFTSCVINHGKNLWRFLFNSTVRWSEVLLQATLPTGKCKRIHLEKEKYVYHQCQTLAKQ